MSYPLLPFYAEWGYVECRGASFKLYTEEQYLPCCLLMSFIQKGICGRDSKGCIHKTSFSS